MKKIVALVAIGLLAVVTSCHTKNVGGGAPVFLSATIAVPANMFGLQNATWTTTITGGIGPYTVAWNFGGGATPNTVTNVGQVGPNSSTTVQMVNATAAPVSYLASVTVTDSIGVKFTTPAPGVSYSVGIIQNQPPVVNSATFAAATGKLTVSVGDPDSGETLTVNVTPPAAGFTIDAPSKVAAATGPLTAVFNIGATDLFAGATGNFVVSVTDSHQATGTFTGGVTVTIPPITIVADHLLAIPLSSTTTVGTPVTIVVATGVPANPFQYLTGVGLTMPSDGDYVKLSFNCGAPGGAIDAIDGIWAAMNPASGFLLGPDNFISATTSQPAAGSSRWDFNITPLNADPKSAHNLTTGSGALFNAQFKFSAAGAKPLGFQQLQGVKRTYYSSDSTEFFWGDITNNQAGVANSITVN